MSSKTEILKLTTADFESRYYENTFSAFGRVKGSHIHVHIFSIIIAVLSIFFYMSISEN